MYYLAACWHFCCLGVWSILQMMLHFRVVCICHLEVVAIGLKPDRNVIFLKRLAHSNFGPVFVFGMNYKGIKVHLYPLDGMVAKRLFIYFKRCAGF